MKITMLTLGSTGDVRPFVLLGRELSSRGHQITVATFSPFREMIESAGLRCYPISGDVEVFMSNIMKPGTSALTYLPQVEKSLRSVAPQLVDDLSASCSDADAIICNFFGSVYYSIAEKYNIPLVQVHLFMMDPNGDAPISAFRPQRMGRVMNEFTYKVGYLLIGSVEKRYLNSWRKENGVTTRKPRTAPDYRIGDHRIPVIYAMSPLVLPRPTEWDEHIRMSGFWYDDTPVSWTPPEDLVRFMEDGDPPVYIGFGSMNSGNMNRVMTLVLRAVHAAHVRAVINLGWSGENLKSTRNVYFGEYIPHDWLFPRVSAVVHHGGAGTTAAGLRYGKPTLVIPFGGDQPFWGNRVRELGCGPKPIHRTDLTVRKLTSALLDLVSHKSYRTSASELSERLNLEKGTIRAADMIEEEIRNW